MPIKLGPIIKWGAVILGLILAFVLISYLRGVYTDLLWYDSLGFKSVFVKILLTRVVLFVIGAAVFAVLVGAGLYVANRLSSGPVTLSLPPETVDLLGKLTVWGSVIAVVILSVIFGSIFASRWEIFLKFANSVQFGEVDPVFGRDISFYVFSMPVYNFVQGWMLGAVIVITLAAVGLYYVNFSLRGRRFEFSSGLKVFVSIMAAVVMLVLAVGLWLDRWDLLL